jgi:RecT family
MTEDNKPVEQASTGVSRVASTVASVHGFDPELGAYAFGNLGDLVLFSDLMSRADVMIPQFLRQKPALCLAVTMRAQHWKMDPFALAQEAYQAKDGGPVGYQAKVFVAALQTCAGVTLNYRYEGELIMLDQPGKSFKGNEVAKRTATGSLKCIAYAKVNGELLEYETPTLDEITIKNSPLWHNNPRDQLAYYAGRGWARRYRPGVIMGAYSADEVEAMAPMRDVTPEPAKTDSFAAIATRARQGDAGATQATTQADHDAQPEADEQCGDDAHWTDGYDPLNGIPGSKEWNWGMESAADPTHEPRSCPFPQGTQEADDWLGGFHGKRKAMSE